MATDSDGPTNDAVRVAALQGAIAALESQLEDATDEERARLQSELATRRRELDRVRD